MTLLFLAPVSAMVPDGQDGREDHSRLIGGPSSSRGGAPLISSPSTSSPSMLFNESEVDSEGWQKYSHLIVKPSSSIEFEQIEEERAATKLRSDLGFGKPQKLFLFKGRRFIKGEVLPYGSCFIDTLKMLFPRRGISRSEFANRLNSAFKGRGGPVSQQEICQELATELYVQLFDLKTWKKALEFNGEEINKLSSQLLKNTFPDYFDFPKESIKRIAEDTKIIEEMLLNFAEPAVMLSLADSRLKKIDIFDLDSKSDFKKSIEKELIYV